MSEETIEFRISNNCTEEVTSLKIPVSGNDEAETELDGISLYVDINGDTYASVRIELYQGQLLVHVWGAEALDSQDHQDEPATVVMAPDYRVFLTKLAQAHAEMEAHAEANLKPPEDTP